MLLFVVASLTMLSNKLHKTVDMTRKRLVMEIGMGTDLRGQDYTKAAIRGLKDALWHNSLTVAPALGYSPEDMQVDIEVAVAEPDKVDKQAVAAVFAVWASQRDRE